MQIPFVYTTERVPTKQATGFDNERGVLYREIEAEHCIWAARVPFLPAMLSADFTRMRKERIPFIMQRQYRFIYDLARAKENHATFELRFIGTPNPVPGQPNRVDIVFLGKVLSTRPRAGHDLALRLWDKFVCNFPLEDPFNYPLEPVTDPGEFACYYQPLPFDEIEGANVLEIRKYEEMPIHHPSPFARVERTGDYIVHPFVPGEDFAPMARFFAALTEQPYKCYAGISLRPTRLFEEEIHNVSYAIGRFRTLVQEDDTASEKYIGTRSEIGAYVYQRLMLEREQLLMVRVYVLAEHGAPYGLAEALGSEMMGNADNKYPTQWMLAAPADEMELQVALTNLRYLEHLPWGQTLAAPPLQRLRYLAAAAEAHGAFRLPAPPESGYMPGVAIKSEPFVAPADQAESLQSHRGGSPVGPYGKASGTGQVQEKRIDLGFVNHRGNLTQQSLSLAVGDLTRHGLIAGSTGSGKSTTIKNLLQQLWRRHRAPFLVLYPIDKPDYRELRGFADLAEDLLIFTLGDESTSPFRFNPFQVPEGLLLKTHLSRLMRVFTAAFTLQDPLPMIYREALRQVYRERGWDTVLERGEAGRDYPVMSEFYDAIDQITSGLNYGREVQDNVRQASVIRIGDLLENAGHVVNVRNSMPLLKVLDSPTVMEIGRVGSGQDTALLMGFLLMQFAEQVERHPRPADLPHITVVEEAHRLMAEAGPTSTHGDSRGTAGEDFANILAEVRGFGEGIIVAEQIPTLLVKGAIGNTYLKVAHWLEDPPSFDLFGKILNLSDEQREYARTLLPGYAIVRSPTGKPVHIKVPRLEDDPAFDADVAKHISDAWVKEHMAAQRRRLGLDDVPIIKWQSSLAANRAGGSSGNAGAGRQQQEVAKAIDRLFTAPLQACAFCEPLHVGGICRYANTVRSLNSADGAATEERARAFRQSLEAHEIDERWRRLGSIGQVVERRLRHLDADVRRQVAYCVFAHLVEDIVRDSRVGKQGNAEAPSVVRQRAREVLKHFRERYSSLASQPADSPQQG